MKKRIILPMLFILLVAGCAGHRSEQYQKDLTQEIQTAYAGAESFLMTVDFRYAKNTDMMRASIEVCKDQTGRIEFLKPDDIQGFSFGVDENGAYFSQDESKFELEGGPDLLPDPLKRVFDLPYYIQNGNFDIKDDTTTITYEDQQEEIAASLEIVNETKCLKSVVICKGNQTVNLDIIEFLIG